MRRLTLRWMFALMIGSSAGLCLHPELACAGGSFEPGDDLYAFIAGSMERTIESVGDRFPVSTEKGIWDTPAHESRASWIFPGSRGPGTGFVHGREEYFTAQYQNRPTNSFSRYCCSREHEDKNTQAERLPRQV